jgi:hypothetical protein
MESNPVDIYVGSLPTNTNSKEAVRNWNLESLKWPDTARY